MTRLAWIFVLTFSLGAVARPNNRAEAFKVIESFLAGQMGVNQLVNRLTFLGEEVTGADELVSAYRRAPARQQGLILQALTDLGVGTEDTEKTFLRALDSDDTSVVVTASRGLGKIKSQRAVPRLVSQLDAKLPVARREAARALGDIGAKKAGPPLMAAAKREDDLEARLVMLVSVGRTGDAKQVPALEALLKDESETTRAAAAQALCLLGAKQGVQYATKLLASDQVLDRLSAVLLFEGASARVAGPPLKAALADPSHKVRANAARVLAQGGDKTKVDWLVLESAKSAGEDKLAYEDQLEKLRLSDEARQAILRKAGL